MTNSITFSIVSSTTAIISTPFTTASIRIMFIHNNKRFLVQGEYVLLHGPRASGKSTSALRAKDQLETKSYKFHNIPIMETLDDIRDVFSTNAEIWS
ncbi:3924_t:CDS:2 [Funneliformis caledonium]|uniref:3924_t:CDS:1 n=1 Tax=Funneliformis caledonium TaxID=1117310 RepID=A0A9N9GYN5_9GLOM|nr:3924_t:CDS:2 [Funneliformis caledonium]